MHQTPLLWQQVHYLRPLLHIPLYCGYSHWWLMHPCVSHSPAATVASVRARMIHPASSMGRLSQPLSLHLIFTVSSLTRTHVTHIDDHNAGLIIKQTHGGENSESRYWWQHLRNYGFEYGRACLRGRIFYECLRWGPVGDSFCVYFSWAESLVPSGEIYWCLGTAT